MNNIFVIVTIVFMLGSVASCKPALRKNDSSWFMRTGK